MNDTYTTIGTGAVFSVGIILAIVGFMLVWDRMPKKWRLPLLTALLVGIAILDTVLAWGGDRFALVMLCGLAIFTSILMGVYGKMVREILDGWAESTVGWSASQDWGMRQSKILQDALADLSEHDHEAAYIHSGRALNSNAEFVSVFDQEEENAKN